jgi:DNA-binding protein YbaB
MFDKMKQLMEFKRQADQIKRELDDAIVDVEEVNGIKLSVTGSQDFHSVEINGSLLKPENKEQFQSDLRKSINAAIKRSQQLAAEKMKSVTGLNVPGL